MTTETIMDELFEKIEKQDDVWFDICMKAHPQCQCLVCGVKFQSAEFHDCLRYNIDCNICGITFMRRDIKEHIKTKKHITKKKEHIKEILKPLETYMCKDMCGVVAEFLN